jgi:hypothetical protein
VLGTERRAPLGVVLDRAIDEQVIHGFGLAYS